MTLSIRAINSKDVGIISDLTRELISELTGACNSKKEFDARAEIILNENKCSGFIAHDGDKPVGILMLCEACAIFAGGRYGVITELYALPTYRSQGIAVKLLEQAKTKAKLQGWKRLEVGAPPQPEWSRSLHFYESNGFTTTGPRLRLALI